MVFNKIENLLKKYKNGETTLAEEQDLKNYFSSDKVAPHLEVYKPMFDYFSLNKNEQFSKKLQLQPVDVKTIPRFNYKWLSVAAVALIVLGVYFAKSINNNDLGTYKDPEVAFNEMSIALEKISKSLNKGASTVGYLDELDNGIKIIFKN